MSEKRPTFSRARFRSPDGNIRIGRVPGGIPATHAVFCKRAKGKGWFLSKAYQTQEAARAAITTINPAWISDVDYVIVEREPF